MGMWNEKVFFYIVLLMDWILSRWHRFTSSFFGHRRRRWTLKSLSQILFHVLHHIHLHRIQFSLQFQAFFRFLLPLKDKKLVARERDLRPQHLLYRSGSSFISREMSWQSFIGAKNENSEEEKTSKMILILFTLLECRLHEGNVCQLS